MARERVSDSLDLLGRGELGKTQEFRDSKQLAGSAITDFVAMAVEPRFWDAQWVHPSIDPSRCYGAFAARLSLALDEVPNSLVARITADQRFRLYVNGKLAAWGPARGDLLHWPYDELDLAQFLQKGDNTLLVIFWSFGHQAPMAQVTTRTGFLVEGNGISTPGSWVVAPVPGFEYGHYSDSLRPTYMVVGPGESVDGSQIASWASLAEADLAWEKIEALWHGRPDGSTVKGPIVGGRGKEEGSGVGETSWHLVPRSIPSMLYEVRPTPPLIASRETGERSGWKTLTMKAGEEVLLDFQELLTAFPLVTAKGGGLLKIRYAEALFDGEHTKGHRDEVKGKDFVGNEDRFQTTDRGVVFEPLWWRCFRYVLLVAEGDVEVSRFDAAETGYPLVDESEWESDGDRHREIFGVAFRTCQRCAGETYFDCPYYEQLQYVGDTRIQAQIGRFVSRDRRLQKQAIDAFAHSVQPNGVIMSRYPVREPQVIAGFSLWWIHMLLDQHLYDPEGVNPSHLGVAQGILDWFEETLEEKPGSAYWAYADWVEKWPGGVPPLGIRSAIQTIHLVHTQLAFAELTGDEELRAKAVARLADFVEDESGVVRDLVWDPSGTPGEQSAALRRLCQMQLGQEPDPWPSPFAADAAPASLFYQWYVHQARPYEDYEPMLKPWRDMLELGLTTFLEIPDPSRSDCHAWSSHPILGFYQRIAGIRSGAPGWSEVVVAPNPGSLTRFRAKVPHPCGDLVVELRDEAVTVDSPVPYRLVWKGETVQG